MDQDELLSGAEFAPETTTPVDAPEDVASAVRAAFEKARSEGSEPEAPEPRARDEQGRFAAKDGDDKGAKPEGRQQASQGQQQAAQEQSKPEAVEPLVLRPPVGWNAAAKAEFARLPPAVQESVARREQEINKGFAVLQEYKGLEEFTPLIKASGITHAELTKRAVEWERSLKTNPVGTVLHVAKLCNVDLARLVGMQQGQQFGNQTPQQFAPQQQQQPAFDQRQVEHIVQRTVAERDANSLVERFLSDPAHVHAEAVADHMAALINSGQAKDLSDAYEKACWANPEIRATLINQQTAPQQQASRQRQIADQARKAGRGITGAPTGRQTATQQAAPATVADAIRMAVAAQRDA